MSPRHVLRPRVAIYGLRSTVLTLRARRRSRFAARYASTPYTRNGFPPQTPSFPWSVRGRSPVGLAMWVLRAKTPALRCPLASPSGIRCSRPAKEREASSLDGGKHLLRQIHPVPLWLVGLRAFRRSVFNPPAPQLGGGKELKAGFASFCCRRTLVLAGGAWQRAAARFRLLRPPR